MPSATSIRGVDHLRRTAPLRTTVDQFRERLARRAPLICAALVLAACCHSIGAGVAAEQFATTAPRESNQVVFATDAADALNLPAAPEPSFESWPAAWPTFDDPFDGRASAHALVQWLSDSEPAAPLGEPFNDPFDGRREPIALVQYISDQPPVRLSADPFAVAMQPNVLRPPTEIVPEGFPEPRIGESAPDLPPYLRYRSDGPVGYAGESSILPREGQQSNHFVPIEDRWRIGHPVWDRYAKGHPITDDYPFDPGRLLNPYKQNVLKGDYPIIGQHTFFNLTVANFLLTEFRQIPTPANPFEAAQNPGQFNPFGDPNQFFLQNNTSVSVDLNHGDSSFKPTDWRLKVTGIFNENYLDVRELGVVAPNVQAGHVRYRQDVHLQEWFFETKLADLSPDYDFLSARVGSQPFVSDFRGFLFSDTNRAVRLFGTRKSNRVQFNLAYFDQQEKDINNTLNKLTDRQQHIVIANLFRQDTIFPGYNVTASFHWNHDSPDRYFDENGVLVRPDPAGVALPHQIDAYYFGFGGDGHINRFNVTHQFYQVYGRDSMNPIAGRALDINASMFAFELSYDRDWIRFKASYFSASGEDDVNNPVAHGFDAIFDNPNFAGGGASYWQRQGIGLQGVNLKNRNSLLPHLRSSKIAGQTNFMNPGLDLYNLGIDIDITQQFRIAGNANLLYFDTTGVLKQFLFQNTVRSSIGTDLSVVSEYRPLLSNNIIFVNGFAAFIPGTGFKDIYSNFNDDADTMFQLFSEFTLQY